MPILSYASTATSYAFGAASSYVFQPNPSSSNPPSPSTSASVRPTSPSSGASSSSDSRKHAVAAHRRTHSHRRNPSYLPTVSPSKASAPRSLDAEKQEGEHLVDRINREEDLYKILGVNRKSKTEEIRRAFLGRSRLCHPDKLPDYPPATPAFQRLSYAYETLSKPSSRRLYDLGGGRPLEPGLPRDPEAGLAEETLNGVLRNVFTEFLAGDFEMIRAFVTALNEGNPGLNLGDEAVDNLEGVFRRVREVVLNGQKYLRLIRFELLRLYEIQHSLRSLGYLDFVGRIRLTLALTRVTLEIPMVLDRAMREEGIVSAPSPSTSTASDGPREDGETEPGEGSTGMENGGGELQRRGLLGPRVKGVLVLACKVLEKGERFGL